MLEIEAQHVELEALFVEPEQIGSGIGAQMFEHATKHAKQLGYEKLLIQSDPNAEGFYLKMRCEKIGEKPSQSIQGRSLPLFSFILK